MLYTITTIINKCYKKKNAKIKKIYKVINL